VLSELSNYLEALFKRWTSIAESAAKCLVGFDRLSAEDETDSMTRHYRHSVVPYFVDLAHVFIVFPAAAQSRCTCTFLYLYCF